MKKLIPCFIVFLSSYQFMIAQVEIKFSELNNTFSKPIKVKEADLEKDYLVTITDVPEGDFRLGQISPKKKSLSDSGSKYLFDLKQDLTALLDKEENEKVFKLSFDGTAKGELKFKLIATEESEQKKQKKNQNEESNQLETLVVTLDLCDDDNPISTNKNRKRLFVRHREFVMFKVVNYNPFKYDVSITNEMIGFNTEVPSEFTPEKSLQGGSQSGNEVEELIDYNDKLKSLLNLSEQIKQFKKDKAGQDCIRKEEVNEFINNDIKPVLEGLELSLVNHEAWDTQLEKKIDEIEDVQEFVLAEFSAGRLTNKKAKYDNIKDSLNKNLKKLKEDKEDIISELASQLNSLSVSYSVKTRPVQVKGNNDLVRFNVNFTKTDDKSNTQSDTYDIPIRRGIKIDFSGGLFATALMDDKFVVRDSMIKKEDQGPARFGLGSLLHFYPRAGKHVNVGGSFGFLVNTDANIQALLGVSLILNQHPRLIFSAGGAFGGVKRLGTGYNEDDAFDKDSSEIPTRTEFNASWFVGITYNISKPNKEQKKEK